MVLYNNSGRTGGRNKSLGVIEATNLYKSGARSETTRVFRAVAGSFKVKNIINSFFLKTSQVILNSELVNVNPLENNACFQKKCYQKQ